jgi:predicted nucleic acid-binding protein
VTSGERYLLDTHVVSELIRPKPNPAVLNWIDAVGVPGLAFSTISRWEIRYGLALLPQGKRCDELTLRFDALVADLFGAGVYDFTTAAAERCASIMVGERALGEPLDDHLPEAMIAGIAAQASLPLATQNRAEFRNCGLMLIDPWAA